MIEDVKSLLKEHFESNFFFAAAHLEPLALLIKFKRLFDPFDMFFLNQMKGIIEQKLPRKSW